MRRFAPVLSAFGLFTACDGDIVLENARPAVTWVEVAPLDAAKSSLMLWVRDAEGEAVDVEVV